MYKGTSLTVQWLRLHASIAEGMGSIPGRGPKIPHATQCGKKTKKQKKTTPRTKQKQYMYKIRMLKIIEC